MLLDEMRTSILDIKSKMLIWKKHFTPPPLDTILTQLMTLYGILQQKLGRFFCSFSSFLKEARSDENVLIYLIEKKEKFNAHLGPRSIEDLLVSFFPAGLDQLRAAVFEGFTRRGFTQFLASVEPLIEALEWEAPCRSAPIS